MRRMVLAPDALQLTDCVAPAPAVEAMRAEAEPTILRRLPNHTPYPERITVGAPSVRFALSGPSLRSGLQMHLRALVAALLGGSGASSQALVSWG